MSLDFKCKFLKETPGQIKTKSIVTYYCTKKEHDIKSCSGCKVKKV